MLLHKPLRLFHLLYLFTATDLKTTVFPNVFIGIAGSYCQRLFSEASQSPRSPGDRICRWLLVAIWVWLNLLSFNANIQSRPEAIKEDSINKSWRPLPAGLVSARDARTLMLGCYGAAVLLSWYLGPLVQCLALIFLGTWYSAWGGGDSRWMIRSALNAAGYLSFATGATYVAVGDQPSWSPVGRIWLAILGLIIFFNDSNARFQRPTRG